MGLSNLLNFLISYLGLVLGFLSTVFRAKVLTVEDIGKYNYVISISLIFSSFLSLGLPQILLRYYPENEEKGFFKFVFKVQIFILIIFSVFFGITIFYREIENAKFILILVWVITTTGILDMLSKVKNKSVISNFY